LTLKRKTLPQPLEAYLIPYPLPPLTGDALYWKERFVGGPGILGSPSLFYPAMTVAVVLGLVVGIGVFLDNHMNTRELRALRGGVVSFYYLAVVCYMLGVGYRAAVSVARERQQHTLDPLLLLPMDRREILVPKLLGTLWIGWPWLVLTATDIIVGVVIG